MSKRKPFKFPSAFQLGGHTIRCVYGKPTPKNQPPMYGRYDEANRTIHVYATARGTLKEETFIHELTHAAAVLAGRKLKEGATQALGALLHQAFTTMEYAEPARKKEKK